MPVIDDLAGEFARLPGIGRKTALRLTFYLLKRPPAELERLARALTMVAARVHACSDCGNLTEQDPCALCANPGRDRGLICVVEEASDIGAIERTAEYRGLYHVLGGRLSPLEGIGPGELNIAPLVARLKHPNGEEAAGEPNEGDAAHPTGASRDEGNGSVQHPGDRVREVIVATNPSVEGEATALYLQRMIQPLGIRVTRLARGLPVGGDLEYADGVTIAEALSGRREI